MSVDPGVVRDLIEAGLNELDDAVVAMDLVVAGSMDGASVQRLVRCVYPISATWTTIRRVALHSLLTCSGLHDACPGDG